MLNLGEYLAPPFFDSISENYEDVMIKHANPFDSKLWIDTIIDNRKKQSFRFFAKELIPFRKNTISVHLLPLLPIINSIIREKGICSITDFGGGIGDNHTEIFNYYDKDMRNKIHYNIIETPNNCILGCQLDQTKKINFVSNDPDAQKGVEIDYILNELQSDIVIICSTLQYLHPYKELLYKFTQSKTKYIYITRTPMNKSVPTFYCRQKVCPNVGRNKGKYLGDIKVTIINEDELIDFMKENKYNTSLNLYHSSNDVDFTNFPNSFNKVYYRNLLFEYR